MANAMLSGKDWWHANQGKYPNSREVADLDPGFRTRVVDFIGALEGASAIVRVSSTRRNTSRAHLMHYSWKVAYGEIDPADVPQRAGVQIIWDHGDVDDSRKAAKEMVQLFGMAHIASLTSNHIKGKAIDMNIDWKGALVLTKPAPLLARVETQPRTGQNRELHRIAAEVYGVRKLVSDPPHWSFNGK
jgi:hypothetical protein